VIVSNLYNPSSLTANYPTTSFEIYTLNADGYVVDGYDTDIKAEDDLKGEKVQLSSIRVEDLHTNTHTNVTVSFAPGTNLGKDSTLVELITLTLPPGLAYRSDYDDQCYVDQIVDFAVACEFELDDDDEYLASVTLSERVPRTRMPVRPLLWIQVPRSHQEGYLPAGRFDILLHHNV